MHSVNTDGADSIEYVATLSKGNGGDTTQDILASAM